MMHRMQSFWVICLGLTVLACAGSRTSHTSAVRVPAPPVSRIPVVLSMDQIALGDSLLMVNDPDRVLQEAQRRYDAAVEAAQSGNRETAQAAIDEVLGLLVTVSNVADTRVIDVRESMLKDLSRLIIALQEGKTPRNTETKGSIPRVMNEKVRQQINWWVRYANNALLTSYARSGLYGEMIDQELGARRMPSELRWLPVVESNFKPRAYSWADAAGLWQFIVDTGKRYGLQRSSWVDDRMDPYKATGAALDHLSALYDMFGDWLLAIAAYNSGEARVLRAINRQGTSDFWELKLPNETKDYVPRFLASVYILENPEQYGLTLPEINMPYVFEERLVNKSISLEDAANLLKIPVDHLKAINTGVRYGVTPPAGYKLRVPLGLGETLLAGLDDIPEARFTPPDELRKYTVRRGDTLSGIAQRYRTSVSKLKTMNRLRSDRLQVGQALQVPGRVSDDAVLAAAKSSKSTSGKTTVSSSSVQKASIHKVRRGDTLSDLARKYGTTVATLKQANAIRSDVLHVGQVIRIPGAQKGSTAATHVVSAGETLWSIARQYGMTVTNVLRLNGLGRGHVIKPGQVLRIAARQNETVGLQ